MKFKTELTSIHFGDTTIQVEGGVFDAELPAELEKFLRSQDLISDAEDEIEAETFIEEVTVAKKPSTRKKKE